LYRHQEISPVFKIPLADVGRLGLWVWKNRRQLDGVPQDPDEFIEAAFSDDGAGIHRAGSTLMRRGKDGRGSPVAFLGQSAHQLADVAKAVSGTVEAGEQVLSAVSLESLQTVSMVTLGLSAITPVLLAAQFGYLRKRFNELQKEIRQLEQLLETRYISELESGLELLESGVRQHNMARIEGALQKCNDAAVFFANRVQSAIGGPQDRRSILLLSRHLAVAVCGTTRCYVAMEEDKEARKALGARVTALSAAARSVFQQTVAKNPVRFLVPELANEVSFASIVALFEQAEQAGALDTADPLQRALASRPTAAEFFQTMRGRLFKSPFGFFRPNLSTVLLELRDATAIVEEANRVLSLGEVLDEAEVAGTKAAECVAWFDQEAKKEPSPFFAWGF
jgi:hypothetical protein